MSEQGHVVVELHPVWKKRIPRADERGGVSVEGAGRTYYEGVGKA